MNIDRTARRFVSLKGASKGTGLPVATLWGLIRHGELHAYASGSRLVRLDVADVERLLRADLGSG